MKVDFIDYLWCVISVIIIGAFFKMGHLDYGILIVYALMDAVFILHIFEMRKKMQDSIAVIGTIKDYHVSKEKFFYPIVHYETEDGTILNSVYFHAFRKKIFEINSDEMICYSPDDPSFFYFMNRESDMTSDYRKYMIVGAIVALILFLMF